MENRITKDLKAIILELQPGEPIALNRLAEIAEQDNSTCESELKQLLSSSQISGKYSEFSQVFILGEATLFCQVDGGNFTSSLAHHTCPSCGRNVCGRCIGQLMAVGLVVCAYCDTEFDPKPVIEGMTSSKDLKVRSYGECLKLMNEGKYEAAVVAFREYLKHNEDDASGWFNLAFSLTKLERYIESIERWKQADKIRPEHANTLINWGYALRKLGRSEEVIHKYQQAVKIRPNDAATIQNWGVALDILGRSEEAIQKYQQADKIRPKNANTLINWGIVLRKLGRSEEVIHKFQQADKIRPEHALTLANWGNALKNLNRFKEARKMYQQAATAARTAGDISRAEMFEKWVKEIQS
ncbi:MAG: tetratricopeptide repeat protein [Candidatus Hodarchaeales archaeon]